MSELTEFRKAKDQYFAEDHHSPLTPEQRKRFIGLTYYPDNPGLRFVLTMKELPYQQKEAIEMATSTGDFQLQLRWGIISFVVNGQSAELTVYRGVDGGDFFLPFAYATNGKVSYGAGRYLGLAPLEGGHILVEFNYAYKPYCAYNPDWSCPIPPVENRLQVPIDAGEKSFPDMVEH